MTLSGVPGITSVHVFRHHCAIVFAANESVPAGRWPVLLDAPAGRITSGFFQLGRDLRLRSSTQQRQMAPAPATLARASAITSAMATVRPSCSIERNAAYTTATATLPLCRELVRFSRAAALREHVELGAEHVAFRHPDLLAFPITLRPALDVESGGLVQLRRRVPGRKVDLVMHEAFGAEDAHREHPRGRPAGADIADLAVGELNSVIDWSSTSAPTGESFAAIELAATISPPR